jgi:hypothetical protein
MHDDSVTKVFVFPFSTPKNECLEALISAFKIDTLKDSSIPQLSSHRDYSQGFRVFRFQKRVEGTRKYFQAYETHMNRK